MNLTEDISDIELKQRWRLYWIHCIFEFSNSSLQRMSWTQCSEVSWPDNEPWESSFEECTSAYFDNLSLYDEYEKAIEMGNVSKEEAEEAKVFHALAYSYIEPSEDPKEILQDVEWIQITEEAKAFWRYLKNTVSSQREITLMNQLEKDFT